VATLEEPLESPVRLAGVDLTDSSVDGRVLTFSLDGSRTPAGSLVATLAQLGALRDISIAEPAIEDVIARLYAGDGGPGTAPSAPS
jgi:ABC-2 type transport system ATP-binding protein